MLPMQASIRIAYQEPGRPKENAVSAQSLKEAVKYCLADFFPLGGGTNSPIFLPFRVKFFMDKNSGLSVKGGAFLLSFFGEMIFR